MAAFYLYFNAAVYAMFAVWCSLAPRTTSASVGYLELSPSGMSEYLVVYGGLEYGIAFFFAYCARANHVRIGLIFALLLYSPMVLFRVTSIVYQWPVTTTTFIVGCLEAALLAGAAAMFVAQRKA